MIYYFLLDLSAVLICGWTGYFLAHNSKTASALHLGVLLAGYAIVFGGAAFLRRTRVLRMLAVPDAADAERLSFGVRLPLDILIFLVPAIIAMAPFGERDIQKIMTFAAPVAVYAGIMRTLRTSRAIEKQTFTFVFVAVVIGLLVLAGFGLTTHYGTIVAVLLVWPVVRIAWYGRLVFQETTKRRIDLFAVNALAGTGIVAGAVLEMQVGPEREQVFDMTWAIIPVALSVILVRLAPRIWHKAMGPEENG